MAPNRADQHKQRLWYRISDRTFSWPVYRGDCRSCITKRRLGLPNACAARDLSPLRDVPDSDFLTPTEYWSHPGTDVSWHRADDVSFFLINIEEHASFYSDPEVWPLAFLQTVAESSWPSLSLETGGYATGRRPGIGAECREPRTPARTGALSNVIVSLDFGPSFGGGALLRTTLEGTPQMSGGPVWLPEGRRVVAVAVGSPCYESDQTNWAAVITAQLLTRFAVAISTFSHSPQQYPWMVRYALGIANGQENIPGCIGGVAPTPGD